MAVRFYPPEVVMPTTPVNGESSAAVADKLTAYTWKPFVPAEPSGYNFELVPATRTVTTGDNTAPISVALQALGA